MSREPFTIDPLVCDAPRQSPYVMHMTIPLDVKNRLNAVAMSAGMSRAALVRQMIDHCLADLEE